ncbi:hypothetical protein [Kribbella sp. CA-293567]|uniref:hypothetical protein n=1 Tax=Kribbella sp. CA-293567 TaxID=3002436 RepID=UPI0022DD7661|nr:hypothetical protein [Kribbella sp. CA-293567]WBQ04380.1 hypothetical protein OX958_31000 [Kribbella sp. CA-293567]
MGTEIEQHASDLLEQLYECHEANENEGATVARFLEGKGRETSYGYTLIDFLDRHGLVRAANEMGGAWGDITSAGIREVQQLRARRADPKIRTAALRREMLQWLYEQEDNDRHVTGWDSFVEDQNDHTERQVRHGAEYLFQHELIKAIGAMGETDGWIRPQLTVDGRACVTDFGGEVSEFLNRGAARPVTNHSTTNTTFNFTDNKGDMYVAGNDFHQKINNAGLDPQQILMILELAGGTKQMGPTLGLSDDQARQLTETAADLHAEADGEKPNHGRLRQLVDKIYEGVKQATPSVAQKTLVTLAEQSIQALTG